ncbi:MULTISPECIES: ABC transporter ATP-binding protein [unclassified Arthrobacter]|uniref:ABC transporter ATP-binding protein n=1 Tax=unclassified Arthrobacter TaxID=235627 RepID=UPI001E4738AD|nr:MULTISPECIES: ABC transporter ATP-binding protein [unclassified Arthrobacter]MCC9145354.1 ABC transporter ATP-binding protein/permease [Arthrobacter sp. zg-Y919]MDK1276582.1 ABC transporter ATP-binding protein [Arthrobacter sp. zg.Y919]WIB01829.1 ABC transporter ATP-binding protein [Arthrobacter sp. zg-Y919]
MSTPGLRGRPGAAAAAKPENFAGSVRRILRLMAPDRLRVAAVLVAAVVSVALAVSAPRILGEATNVIFDGFIGQTLPAGMSKDAQVQALRNSGERELADMLAAMDVIPGQGLDFARLGAILLGVLAIYLAAFAFGWFQARVTARIVQNAMYRLRRDVDGKLFRLPMSHFQQQSRGDVLSRVTNDIDNLAQTLSQSLTQILTSVLTIIGVLAMMVSISPLLALIAVVTVPVSALVTVLIARRSQAEFKTQWKSTGEVNGYIEEMFTGQDVVKAFGQQERVIEGFAPANNRLYRSAFRAQFVSGIIMPAMMFISNLNYVAVAVVGGLQVASGQLSIGGVQAFVQYSRQFSQPLGQLGGLINMLQSGVASAERVFALLDAKEQAPDPDRPEHLPAVRGRVAFEDVSFDYSPDAPLIRHLSFTAEPGQTVAIVGPTGAGKTTLVNLLMRFYEVDAGRITIDGVDIARLNREELRSHIGMVLQDAWLFEGTVRENLAYGAPDATEEQIVQAAQATHVDHFVRSLPEGYDTVLGYDGGALSQGQRQLLTIARAWLSDPSILVLDEATSSVDTRTEIAIRLAMNALRQDRTSFVIAHRLSTIRDADLILVVRDGQIVEQGMHEALLAAEGFYAGLYRSQFAGPDAEPDREREADSGAAEADPAAPADPAGH